MLKKIAMVLSLNVCRVTSLPEDCSPHDVNIAYIAGRSWGRVDIWVLGLEPWWNTDLDPGPGIPDCDGWWAAEEDNEWRGERVLILLVYEMLRHVVHVGDLVLMYWYFFCIPRGHPLEHLKVGSIQLYIVKRTYFVSEALLSSSDLGHYWWLLHWLLRTFEKQRRKNNNSLRSHDFETWWKVSRYNRFSYLLCLR